MAFNRSRGGGRDFNRPARPVGGPRFSDRGSDRGSRGPVEMHKAVCDQCRRECEVPFRPTSGKPIYCSSCFENSRGSEPRRQSNFEDRPMFDATCDDCGNSCKVPFQPRGDKPIFCSNCFGEKKGAGSRESTQPQPQYNQQFEALNNKLDRILQLLDPQIITEIVKEEVIPVDPDPAVEKQETKPVKKKPAKKNAL